MAAGNKRAPRPRSKRAAIAWLWTAFFAALMLFSVAATRVSPTTAPLLAPFGLLFPWATIAATAGAIALLSLGRWRVLLWASAIFLLSAPALRATFGSPVLPSTQSSTQASALPTFTLLSWNVRLFDFYGWIDGREAPERAEDERLGTGPKAAIFRQIAAQSPDVLCLQEFYFHADPLHYNTTDSLQACTALNHLHVEYTHHMGAQRFGVATFSKHPIIGRDVIRFESDENNVCAVTDVLAGKDTLRIFNAHLSSLRFQDEDYRALDGRVPDARERARLLGRLTAAYRLRVEQLARVLTAVESSPHRVILCGDFNDTPVSYALHSARELLCDAHDASFGIAGTWQGAVPGMRIDYILHDFALSALGQRSGGEDLSDHRWVASEFVLSAE
jgi:endonuclease/exonuclease/phosphatase family metal-dependent hydrolase